MVHFRQNISLQKPEWKGCKNLQLSHDCMGNSHWELSHLLLLLICAANLLTMRTEYCGLINNWSHFWANHFCLNSNSSGQINCHSYCWLGLRIFSISQVSCLFNLPSREQNRWTEYATHSFESSYLLWKKTQNLMATQKNRFVDTLVCLFWLL